MTNNPQYTDVDLNATGTTTVCDVDGDVRVYGAFGENAGSTAAFNLEATDGTDTAVLSQPGAGNNLELDGPVAIDNETDLQINVTTAEGSDLTMTVVTFPGA